MEVKKEHVEALDTYLKYFQANVFKEITGGHMIALIKAMEVSCELVNEMKKELEEKKEEDAKSN